MINGIGTTFYGKINYVTNGEIEEYDTTKWFCVFWLPIFPFCSYRIQRKYRADIISKMARQLFWSETIYLINKRPLDVKQIISVYIWTYGSIIGSSIIFLLIAYFIDN